MDWLLLVGVLWVVISFAAGLVLGRFIRFGQGQD